MYLKGVGGYRILWRLNCCLASSHVTQAAFELLILPSLPFRSWEYRCVPLYSALSVCVCVFVFYSLLGGYIWRPELDVNQYVFLSPFPPAYFLRQCLSLSVELTSVSFQLG